MKTQAIEDWRVFASISQLSIPQSDSCDLHMLECEELGQNGGTKLPFALFRQINQPFALLSKLNREIPLF